uniref:Reverse transcriptase Ty1/copia-type domain-containing protein n=1 Tax=Chromera velia CCMP2878 TaxID=1169474 RepID=A0A0G4FXK8_9ALVE|eukprot:Cvel_3885.t1-p1 / transcript=Cvel_3885.t1 / gene=Cvel_3885 / organism=Chromera_velia_CCMP2878 / gene_product=Retrovirus-related Pol polyprotein from transposon, putative / transcript_product=Retrovirus-related Pol polyprotein from transposon, putative / location=Cvel_scaffold164:73151-85644(+) / protein_length=1195 / sequence_SO=supercontig / SO=protein_coding / is_pseudo=false
MNDSFSSYSSSPSLSGVSPGLEDKGRGSDEVDDGAFSDIDVEEVPCDAGDRPPAKFFSSFASARFFPSVSHTAAQLYERHVATSVSSDIGGAQPFSFPLQSPAGIQIQTGQLEMYAQQEEGEEGEREERKEAERDSEPRRGARRLPKRKEREDGGDVPPFPVAEDVEVDWGVDSDGNALHTQEGREEVQAAQDNEEKEEALRERLVKLKEELARMIAEKEKKRRPLPRIVPVDPTVVKKMMSHVNPRKGHIDATNEEVKSGSHEKGMLDKLQRFLDETVFRRGVRVPKGRKVMRCRWVLTWKLKGGKRVAKAHLVVKGFQDDRKDLQTYSGTADWWSVLLVLSFAATKGWGYAKSDVHTAFLTAEMKDEVYVRLLDKLPAGLPEWMKTGSVFHLNKAIYGLKDAPHLYTQSFRKMAKEEGWKELRETVFVKKGEKGEIIAIMLMHVDDLLIFTANPLIHFAPIQKRLKMDEPELLEEGESFEYVGMTLTRTREGYKIGQKAYLDSIEIDEKKLLRGRLNASLLKPPEEGEVLEDLIPLMQKCTGVMGTPFVSNTPGLATHTAALTGDLTGSASAMTATFTSDVQLEAGSYTVIAHVRYYSPDTDTKWDIAIGKPVTIFSSSACSAGYYHLGGTSDGTCTPCAAGTYSNSTGAFETDMCISCEGLQHLNCTGGDSLPLSAAGYWTRPVDTPGSFTAPETFKCNTPGACLGGTFDTTLSGASTVNAAASSSSSAASVGAHSSTNVTEASAQCNGKRTGFMCETCPEGMYKSGIDCASCETSNMSWPLLVVIVGVLILMVICYYAINGSYTAQYSPIMGLVASLSIVLLFAQYVSVLNSIDVSLPSELTGTFSFLEYISLDWDGLRQECAFTDTTPIEQFATQVMLPFIFTAMLFSVYGLTFLLHRFLPRFQPWELDKVLNVLGFVLQIVYVILSVNSLKPFDCVSHPSGDKTLRTFPGVFCGTAEHNDMVILGSFMLVIYLIGIPLYLGAVCVFAKWFSERDEGFTTRNKFLFARFSPIVYWWGVVVLMKNVLFAVIPVLAPDNAIFVLLMLGVMNMCFAVAQVRFWPWVDMLSNYVDVALSIGVGTLILVYSFYADKNEGLDFLVPAAITTVALLLAAFLGIIGYQLYLWFRRKEVRAKKEAEGDRLAAQLATNGKQLSLAYERAPDTLKNNVSISVVDVGKGSWHQYSDLRAESL